MLRLIFSNATERLADLLLERLADGPSSSASPFDPEHLIVPHAGMRRYLELRHADRFGIAANLQCAYPAQWLWQQITRILPDASQDSPYSADVLTWRVLHWLDSAPVQGRLATYLAHSDALMRYELAARIARLLEQFVTYRSDWLAAWATGRQPMLANATAAQRDDAAWLAAAWRHVLAANGGPAEHPAERLLQQLAAQSARLGDPAAAAAALGLPPRVALFGLAELPPFYLSVLTRLAHCIDIDCYIVNPSAEYWFDIVSLQRRARLQAEGRLLHHEVGHALLAHWGGQTRAFIEAVLEVDDADLHEAWIEPVPDNTLRRLQQGILHLEEPAPGTATLDDSITIFSCHTMTRQLEVLHDQLLAAFDADPTLRPHEVLVVMPDLDLAAPAIEASFGTVPPGHARHVPWRITGLSSRQGAPLARALFALLDLAGSRWEASVLFDVLQQPAVARRFGLDESALDGLHAWIRETGIHWGRDAAHRASLDLPATGRHTLEHGLRQLFLGYAMPLPEGEAFADCLPYPDIEGQQAEWLGALWSFVARLDRLTEFLRTPHDMTAWCAALQTCVADFLDPASEDDHEALAIAGALADLARLATAGGAAALPVPVEVVRRALEARLMAQAPGGTPGGAVTFTGMTPLRQLPYRVVCVLGLDHGAFPADAPADEFDLMAAFPRPGDRQRRRDDRNVFLDLILAARERLIIGYNGRNSRDNGVLPPSVVVDELIDWLVRAASPTDADDAGRAALRARLVTGHPLQAHAPRYFDGSDGRLFSYRRELCAALAQPAPPPTPFFTTALPAADAEEREFTLRELVQFLRNPARALLENRLEIDLRDHSRQIEDDEPFTLARADSWDVKDRVLAMLEAGRDPDAVRAAVRLHNAVPDGMAGALEIEPLLAAAESFAARLGAARGDSAGALEPLPVRLDIGGAILSGELTGLSAQGMLLWRFGKESALQWLEAWVRHLVLCCVRPPGVALVTRWLDEEGACHFVAPADPGRLLADLVALFRAGQTRPLHFFPKSACAYAQNVDGAAHRRVWHSDWNNSPGESDHPAYQMAFGLAADPGEDAALKLLDAEFEGLALRVYGPLFAARVEGLDADA